MASKKASSDRALALADLEPYLALLVLRISDAKSRRRASLLNELIEKVALSLDIAEEDSERIELGRGEARPDGGLTVAFLHYLHEKPPSWAPKLDLRERLHHLVLCCQRGRYLALFLSETGAASRLLRAGDLLSPAEPIPQGLLNAAFAEGAPRTLWLSGVHTPTSVKATSKVLTGADLRDALDPLGDQTYYFTAARCLTELDKRKRPVGLSPRHSKIWVGPTSSWAEFCSALIALLDLLAEADRQARSNDAPLPILAVPLTDPEAVDEAFDLSILDLETVAEPIDQETQDMLHRWADDGSFSILSTSGANFTAEVSLSGKTLGQLSFEVDVADPKNIALDVSSTKKISPSSPLGEALRLCRHPHWIQIRYESGHTVSDGLIYKVRYRDAAFTNWQFLSFPDTDITKEKPTRPTNGHSKFAPQDIGHQGSLFCWVWNTWPDLTGQGNRCGWLASDDHSMEAADFIHLDDSLDPPLLSLIHVKGSHSIAPNRGISVSDYEVVTGQAVKNLRHLDRLILAQGLSGVVPKKIISLVWHEGKQEQDRTGMLAALAALGSSYRRRVIILQPRLTKSSYESARQAEERGPKNGSLARLRQLDALLLAAEASFHELGAELLVLGHADD